MPTERVIEHIQGLSDAQLAEYVAVGEAGYEPAAVDFARQEFARRNLDAATMSQLTSAAELDVAADNAAIAARAQEPLDWDGKFLAFVGGMFMVGYLFWMFRIWVAMDINGQHRKAAETKKFFFAGFAFTLTILIIAGVISYLR